ncbi:hypothetical protein MTCD1_03429 [Colwellia marinimaniae]|uniref:Uncharacterized protein n=1 Tax=Colwellia marinimaniae TaxID=1513592 RepID=A0ABQ0MZI7_9GAMM|nr:hypothetical protein MTCD1_03429 [Colwellia marinimaniae]
MFGNGLISVTGTFAVIFSKDYTFAGSLIFRVVSYCLYAVAVVVGLTYLFFPQVLTYPL